MSDVAKFWPGASANTTFLYARFEEPGLKFLAKNVEGEYVGSLLGIPQSKDKSGLYVMDKSGSLVEVPSLYTSYETLAVPPSPEAVGSLCLFTTILDNTYWYGTDLSGKPSVSSLLESTKYYKKKEGAYVPVNKVQKTLHIDGTEYEMPTNFGDCLAYCAVFDNKGVLSVDAVSRYNDNIRYERHVWSSPTKAPTTTEMWSVTLPQITEKVLPLISETYADIVSWGVDFSGGSVLSDGYQFDATLMYLYTERFTLAVGLHISIGAFDTQITVDVPSPTTRTGRAYYEPILEEDIGPPWPPDPRLPEWVERVITTTHGHLVTQPSVICGELGRVCSADGVKVAYITSKYESSSRGVSISGTRWEVVHDTYIAIRSEEEKETHLENICTMVLWDDIQISWGLSAHEYENIQNMGDAYARYIYDVSLFSVSIVHFDLRAKVCVLVRTGFYGEGELDFTPGMNTSTPAIRYSRVEVYHGSSVSYYYLQEETPIGILARAYTEGYVSVDNFPGISEYSWVVTPLQLIPVYFLQQPAFFPILVCFSWSDDGSVVYIDDVKGSVDTSSKVCHFSVIPEYVQNKLEEGLEAELSSLVDVEYLMVTG